MNREKSQFVEIVEKEIPEASVIAEVGVFMAKDCLVDPFIQKGVRCILVEPQSIWIASLENAYEGMDNVELHKVAVGFTPGQTYLYVPPRIKGNPDAGASAYIDEAYSPYQVRTGENVDDMHSERVEVVTFDMIDDGKIDAIHIDTEGLEWAVLANMKSRPKVLSVEMYGPNGYVNPYRAEIQGWLKENRYVLHTTCQVQYPRKGVWIDTDEIYIKEST
jgi:FkbM family methyltransferase